MKNNKLLGYIFIIPGAAFLLGINIFEGINTDILSIALLILTGLAGAFISLGRNKRITLFISTIIFLFGIYMFVTNIYVMTNIENTLFPSILFMSGAGSLMLFVENKNEKVFLIIAAFLFVLSALFIFAFTTGFIPHYANKIVAFGFSYWAEILVLMGFLILAGRYK